MYNNLEIFHINTHGKMINKSLRMSKRTSKELKLLKRQLTFVFFLNDLNTPTLMLIQMNHLLLGYASIVNWQVEIVYSYGAIINTNAHLLTGKLIQMT